MAGQSTVRVRRAVGRGSAAVIDQVFSSASGLLLLVTAARAGDAATFGALSIALICNGFVLGCVRAYVGEIAMMRIRRSPGDVERNTRTALMLACCTGAAATGVFLLAGWVIGGDTGTYLGLMGLAALPVHLQDVQRFLCFGIRRMGVAISIDVTWLGVQAIVVTALLVDGSATVERLVVAWIAGAVAGALAGFAVERWWPSPRGLRAWLAEDGRRGLGFVGDFVVSTGLVQAAMLSLGALLTLEEFGAIRLAFVSLSPLANLLAGIRALVLASLGGLRRAPNVARQRAIRAAVMFGAIGVLYGVVLVALPVDWGEAALGEGWSEAHSFVGIICIGEVLRLGAFPAIDLLKVFRSPAALVTVRFLVTLLGVVALVAAALVGGPTLVAIAATVSAAISFVTWWRQATLGASAPANRRLPRLSRSPGP